MVQTNKTKQTTLECDLSVASSDMLASDIDSNSGGEDDETITTAKNQIVQHEETTSKSTRTVYFVLFLAAIGFALATYFLLSAQEQQEFESSFESYARETADIAENNADNCFGQLRTMATSFTSLALDQNGFPNVTVPHFDIRAQEITDLTGAEMILFVPFVEKAKRVGWEEYAQQNEGWISQDYNIRGWNDSSLEPIASEIYNCTTWCQEIRDNRTGFVDTDNFMEEILDNLTYSSSEFSTPVAQFGPAPINTSLGMLDLFSHPTIKKEIIASLEYDVPVISETSDLNFLLSHIALNQTAFNPKELRSFTLDQVKEDFLPGSRTIGYVMAIVPWSTFFVNLLPPGVNGIVVKVVSDCGSNFTYVVNGDRDSWALEGEHHDPKWEDMAFQEKFFWKQHHKGRSRHCHFDLVIYPSQEFYELYSSSSPALYAGLVLLVFLFTAVVFLCYQKYMGKHHGEAVVRAARAEALVNSVFPKEIGHRLMQRVEQEAELNPTRDRWAKSRDRSTQGKLSTFLNTGLEDMHRTKPLADLFLNCTIMFADIVGFTAWSSTRDPSQVFILLETIYKEFDELAKRRRVFKVETVGDCYVAVAGLPTPRRDHFIAMARFAGDCLNKLSVLTRQLEVELGPDTADLGIRIGVHSGPVTAGVLRGERARFQLFGDTVNTTARMESTGENNRIQISKETADLLEDAGKGHWCKPREDKVMAKGKGELQTYWLKNIKTGGARSIVSFASGHQSTGQDFADISFNIQYRDETKYKRKIDKKLERLINWNVEVLTSFLKQIEERRLVAGIRKDTPKKMKELEMKLSANPDHLMALDEVVEIVDLPNFNAEAHDGSEPVELSKRMYSQLREYITQVALMYQENPFHNFEHASHVTMSVMKLLGRIVAPDIMTEDARDLHDHTYGITSDPLTQFAVVLSAMLHDVDHPGVPNTTLISEDADIAGIYKNKSIAEQNSVDLAWDLLMEDSYSELRRAIYATENELKRFRQLIVNTILATDIMDKELKALRNSRWENAFTDYTQRSMNESTKDMVNRKATIVIEHLIQASDVAHTMQHWQIYRKWNARLFQEMYKAYEEGRSETDPSEGWYKGEMGFFDFYIIPLAKKLEECGVFGVSSHEYLNYAKENREEWELKGQGIVEEYLKVAKENKTKIAKKDLTSVTDHSKEDDEPL